MKYKLLFASGMVAVAAIGAAPAYAGPPNAECGEEGATSTPGNAATSPGSVFNEPGTNSINGGTGNQAYNNAGAPSQYDVACAKVTAADAGTPMQTTTPTTDITNNARGTRAVSHVGNGANK
jgi:hypothetical protein